jgi:hypothetical protein
MVQLRNSLSRRVSASLESAIGQVDRTQVAGFAADVYRPHSGISSTACGQRMCTGHFWLHSICQRWREGQAAHVRSFRNQMADGDGTGSNGVAVGSPDTAFSLDPIVYRALSRSVLMRRPVVPIRFSHPDSCHRTYL